VVDTVDQEVEGIEGGVTWEPVVFGVEEESMEGIFKESP
jgi:hypothetical protein